MTASLSKTFLISRGAGEREGDGMVAVAMLLASLARLREWLAAWTAAGFAKRFFLRVEVVERLRFAVLGAEC